MKPLFVVLDTNVVLDWFVFHNPGVKAIARAIEQGSVRWLCSSPMRAELAHVLANARFGEAPVDCEHVLTLVNRLAHRLEPTGSLSLQRLRCSDSSDQMFIDLALSQGARWLLSRDRALLKLARKAAVSGLLIQTPEAWRPELDADADTQAER